MIRPSISLTIIVTSMIWSGINLTIIITCMRRCILILQRTQILTSDLIVTHHFQGDKVIQFIGGHLVRNILDCGTGHPCNTCFDSYLYQLLCHLATTRCSDSTAFNQNLAQQIILNNNFFRCGFSQ